MSSLIGPIESAAFCVLMAYTPPTEGSVNCGGDAFTVAGITYQVQMPSPSTTQILAQAWLGGAGVTSPDVNYDAGAYDANGVYVSPKGFSSREQEVASRQLQLFLGQYALKLIASRAAAILVLDEVEALRNELGVGSLKEMLDMLYAHGWRDMDGWTTAIGRPIGGFEIDGTNASVDAFWLAWYYAKLIAGAAHHWNKASVPDLATIEGHPYYAFDEYPYLTSFQNWRPSNALLEHDTIVQPVNGNPYTFKIDIDTTLDPLLRSSSVAEIASQIYRMFATLGKAASAIRKEHSASSGSGGSGGGLPGEGGSGGFVYKPRGNGGGGGLIKPGQPGGGLPGEGGGGAFTPGGKKPGGLKPSQVFTPLPDEGGPGGKRPGGGTDGTEEPKGWPWWKTGLAVLAGAAAVAGAGFAFLRGTGRLANPTMGGAHARAVATLVDRFGPPLPHTADWQVDAWSVGRGVYITADDGGTFLIVQRTVNDDVGVFEDEIVAEGEPQDIDGIIAMATARVAARRGSRLRRPVARPGLADLIRQRRRQAEIVRQHAGRQVHRRADDLVLAQAAHGDEPEGLVLRAAPEGHADELDVAGQLLGQPLIEGGAPGAGLLHERGGARDGRPVAADVRAQLVEERLGRHQVPFSCFQRWTCCGVIMPAVHQRQVSTLKVPEGFFGGAPTGTPPSSRCKRAYSPPHARHVTSVGRSCGERPSGGGISVGRSLSDTAET
jgi:hypothetical protein